MESLDNIKKQITNIIYFNSNSNITSRINPFITILNVFTNNNEFIKYHTKNKIKNLLLYSINLIIENDNDNNNNIVIINKILENQV